MAPVTELILLNIKPDLAPDTLSSTIDSMAATLLSQPGCLLARSSPVLGDPTKVRLFVDWDAVSSHEAFSASASFAPFLQTVGAIVASPPTRPYHVPFAPYPPAALDNARPYARSPVAELLHVWFAADFAGDAAARKGVEDTANDFVGRLAGFAEGLTGELSTGWTVENDIDREGKPHCALVVALGWRSVEAQRKACEHEEFAKIIPMMKNLEGLKGLELCFVSNKTVERAS